MNSYSADWATKLHDLTFVHGPYLAVSTIIWTIVYLASAPISRSLSATYRGLPFKLKMQWDNRIVALLHAVLICYATFWGLLFDEPLKADHLHAYSSWAYGTMITACGYFIWDAVMCIIYFKEFQLGFLLHALGCLFTFLGSLVRSPASPTAWLQDAFSKFGMHLNNNNLSSCAALTSLFTCLA
jgi:hypothetical protein